MSDNLLPLPAVLAKVGLQKTKVYALIKEHQFPEPVKLGRLSRWSEAEVAAWIEAQKQKAA